MFDFFNSRSRPAGKSGRQLSEADEIAEMRAQSAETVGKVYCFMALGCAAMALMFHWGPTVTGLPIEGGRNVANAFVAIAAMDLVLLAVWERVFLKNLD